MDASPRSRASKAHGVLRRSGPRVQFPTGGLGPHMIDTMFGALFGLVSSPHIMGLMLIAVIFGLLVGVTPGIGGKLSIAMAIPFVYGMDMVAGAVFLLTMHAVNGTSGQISSIMFGIPGDGDDAATTLDGYPLAKQGQAARALGASITASGVGGIIGAVVFAVMIPILEPVVLAVQPGRVLPDRAARDQLHRLPLQRRQDREGPDRRLLGPHALHRRHGPADRHAALCRRHAVPVGRCQPGHRRAGVVRGAGDDRARHQGRLDLRGADGGQELLLPAVAVRRDGGAAPLVAGDPDLGHRRRHRHDSRASAARRRRGCATAMRCRAPRRRSGSARARSRA